MKKAYIRASLPISSFGINGIVADKSAGEHGASTPGPDSTWAISPSLGSLYGSSESSVPGI